MVVKIIGAGPAGLWAAKHLGPECMVYEEHKKIGHPVHCTGLISRRIDSLVRLPKEAVVNRIHGARLFSHNGLSLELTRGRPEAYVIDRARFDLHLAGLAQKAGAKIVLGQKANPGQGVTIAADGASSRTRKSFGLQLKAIPSLQYILRPAQCLDPNFVELHFINRDFFAWVVPENEKIARVGVADRRCRAVLDSFVRKRFERFRIRERQAGLVVVGGPMKKTVFGNTMLVGDAAGQVKATTGGGIITGMMCAEVAARCAQKPQSYENAWRRSRVGRELAAARAIRELLSNLEPKDYESLIEFGERNLDLMKKHGDMDFHSRMILEMLKRPGNWLLVMKLIAKGVLAYI